jgi:hypothetical protein
VNCPKCKKPGLRQQVSVFVECDAGRSNLSKSGIRGKDVVVLGAGWPTAAYYCLRERCGFYERMKPEADGKTKPPPAPKKRKGK